MRSATSDLPAAALLAALAAGCAGGKPVGTAAGRVTYRGEPVTRGQVLFEDAPRGVAVVAALGEGGRYAAASADGRGLPPGRYKVAVQPPPPAVPFGHTGPLPPSPGADSIPPRYRDPKTSGWEAEVRPGGNPPFDFAMTD